MEILFNIFFILTIGSVAVLMVTLITVLVMGIIKGDM
jgi:hypothetical protein